MHVYQTGAVRDTGGKGRMDLLPMCALLRVSRHMEDAIKPDPETGMPHYAERNWEQGLPVHTMIDSALRHLAKYVDGMDDEDHLCAAATNLLMAMWTEEKRPDLQDIPSRAPSLALPSHEDDVNVRNDHPSSEAKEDPKERLVRCSYFNAKDGTCTGTKDCDPCYCNGNRKECTFYDR